MCIRVVTGFLFLVSSWSSYADGADAYVATATLMTSQQQTYGSTANSYVVGTITFTQKPGESTVRIEGHLKLDNSFSPVNTSIGFHVHTTSNFTGGCASAGAHYNPENKTHGGPTDAIRHVGDLGNVVFDTNTKESHINFTDSVITLVGSRTIVGRSLVLHQGTDDLGKGGNEESLKTGNAGVRYACGAIVLASDFSPSSATSVFVSAGQMAMTTLMATISIAVYGFRW